MRRLAAPCPPRSRPHADGSPETPRPDRAAEYRDAWPRSASARRISRRARWSARGSIRGDGALEPLIVDEAVNSFQDGPQPLGEVQIEIEPLRPGVDFEDHWCAGRPARGEGASPSR